MDRAWILVRRAAGHDQRRGALARMFALTAMLVGAGFMFWFWVIHGPASGGNPNLGFHGSWGAP